MYSAKVNEEEFLAGKARIEEVDASFKDLGAVCDNIRYKRVADALTLLEKAAKGEIPIRYYKHNKKLAHRKELNGKKGRYPKKAAKIVLDILRNAVANAVQKGASEDALVVKHAAANKKRTYYRVQPKGRRMRHDYELARVEIIVVQKMSDELKARMAKLRELKAAEKKEEAKKAEEKAGKKEAPKQKEAAKEGKASKNAEKAEKAEQKPKPKKQAKSKEASTAKKEGAAEKEQKPKNAAKKGDE